MKDIEIPYSIGNEIKQLKIELLNDGTGLTLCKHNLAMTIFIHHYLKKTYGFLLGSDIMNEMDYCVTNFISERKLILRYPSNGGLDFTP
jgi:hypothetical protein